MSHHSGHGSDGSTYTTDHVGHEASDSSSNHMMSMVMNFHGGFKEAIVFEGWNTRTIGEFVGSCIALFIIACLYEGIKSIREYFLKLEIKKYENNFESHTIFNWIHFVQSMLHVVQVGISYILMLVVMTYNSWIFAVVTLGAGLGFFIFGRKRLSVIDINEHCH